MGASKRRLGDVADYREDENQLCFECQHHKCGGYCMRNHRRKKNKEQRDKTGSTNPDKASAKRRYCRAGAGYEATPNACDTPGFQLRSDHAITRDDRDFLKLEMKRNNLRMIQTPLHVLRGWRGNCDIKVLLYDCHEGQPTPEDIAEVTDYVVAYEVRFARNRAQGRDQKMSIFGPATRTRTHACKARTIKTDKRALHMHVRHVCVVAQI